jgi:hypothetical protein
MIVIPAIAGIYSGQWVVNSIDYSSLDFREVIVAIILGFSLSLIWSFFTGIIISRLSGQGMGSEIVGGCLNIFFSGLLGGACAGISCFYQLLNNYGSV